MDAPPTPTQPFTIDPEVERVMHLGQHQRAMSQRVRACLAKVTDQLLREYPGQLAAIATAIEGEAAWIRSLPEQQRRREREAQRIKEQDGNDRRDAPAVQDGVPRVSGIEP
jgi:hypothetical protein